MIDVFKFFRMTPRAEPPPPLVQTPSPHSVHPSGQTPTARKRNPKPARASSPTVTKPRTVTLGEQTLTYHLRRSRRSTIGLLIDANGLRITAPTWASIGQIEQAIAQRQSWIESKLQGWQQRLQAQPTHDQQWILGAKVSVLGQTLTLARSSTRRDLLDQAVLMLALPDGADSHQIQARFQRWMQDQARQVFAERLALFERDHQIKPAAWSLSSARTRWGSCSTARRIRLNWRLLHYPMTVVDYVIAHELAHLTEMNHSERFWRIVGVYHPDFAASRKLLKHPPPGLVPTYQ